MIKVIVMVQDGIRSETFGLDLAELGPEELAMVEDLALELRARVDRLAKIRAAKARKSSEGET